MGSGARAAVGRITFACAVAACLALCSPGAAPAGAAPSNRACDLLTTKQVKAALGAAVGAPKASKSSGSASCDWKTTGAAEPQLVSIAISPLGKAEKAKFVDLADDDDNVVFDDLGDQAVLECNGALRGKCLTWGKLWIAVDDEYLGIFVGSPKGAAQEADILEALGRQAVKEL